MRIDNDFLTLLDLTVKLAMAKANRPVAAYPAERERDRVNIENMTLKRDALVAKINADHDATTKALMASINEQHGIAAQVVRMIEEAMGRPAGADRDAIIAMLRNDLKHSRATIDAITANLKKREASMVEVKDAAPAPIHVEKWAFATGLTSTGYVQLFHDPADTLAFICRQTSPVTVTKVRDELAGNGCGADIYEVRWNVSPKDADGEGR